MLIRAFEIQDFVLAAVTLAMNSRETRKVLWIVQREGMGRARIEPDIEDVVDLFVFVRVVIGAEEARGRRARVRLLPS